MNAIKKNKVLLTIIAILLLANIGILVFFLGQNPARASSEASESIHRSFSDFLRQDVGFSEEQVKEFQSLKKEHKSIVKPLFEDLRVTKEEFYNRIHDTTLTGTRIDSAARPIGDKQMLIDAQTFRHFRNLRRLCTAEQKHKFDSLFPEMVKRMTSPQKKSRDHKK